MTERPFLPHDLGTRNDPKMVALELDGFPLGKAIWWDLLEMLYEQGGKLPTNYKSLAYILRYPTEEQVRHLVEDFDLFKVFESEDGRMFTNESAKARIARKMDATEQRREAGIASGRARRGTPVQTPVERPLNTRSNAVQTPVEQSNQIKSNQINQSINQRAGAGTPAREDEEDYLMFYFFGCNWIDPVGEVKRCMANYAGQDIKNIHNVAKGWHPEKNGIRFTDPRSMDLAMGIYGDIRESATPHEAVEFLRHVDAIDVDKGRNEVKIRMLGADWQTSIQGVLDENPALVQTFDHYKVTKRINS